MKYCGANSACIAVLGGASVYSPDQVVAAYVAGREIARRGKRLLTGATTGIPYAAAIGAKEAGGTVIGISPASSPGEHTGTFRKPLCYVDIMIYTGLGMAGRTQVIVRSAAAAVFIGGEFGTLNEFASFWLGGEKVLGILECLGGMTASFRDLVERVQSKYGNTLIWDDDAAALVQQVCDRVDEAAYVPETETVNQIGHDIRQIIADVIAEMHAIMNPINGDYVDWRGIDYQPAATMLPEGLLPYLKPGGLVLDVGCNRGVAALFLARHQIRTIGLDVNPEAIATAEASASAESLQHLAQFNMRDITEQAGSGDYDAVMLIRVLTCFPRIESWERVLKTSRAMLKNEGLLYVKDFVMDESSEVYCDRYVEGIRQGWRRGNFLVNDRGGQPLFIAHHHPDSEIENITRPYVTLLMERRPALSMNGNPCMMFEFIGRKVEVRGQTL